MKHLKKVLLVLILCIGFNMNAQDENNPWSMTIGTNAVDFFPTNEMGGWFSQFVNDEHFNIVPSVTRLRVGKYLGNGFGIGVSGSLNKIDRMGETRVSSVAYVGADLDINYALNNLWGGKKWFDPFFAIGGGYTWLDGDGTATGNAGAGFNLWFNDFVGLNLQTTYKHSFDTDALLPHFQHSVGLALKFGGKDTDGDGVYDKDDECPEVFGLEAFNGCPDTDGDGIKDGDDACPETAGLAALNGCPDADGDGVADKDDQCPNDKGTAANNGCPDADGDGIYDKDDSCVDQAGPKENKGCPWPDTDGDGVLDKDDNCVNEVGPASNQGCPEKVITVEAKKELDEFANSIYFNSSKTTFRPGVVEKLDLIVGIMKEYKDSDFSIEGHTDSSGPTKFNQTLSESRAKAILDYLVEKGISSTRLASKGFGEDNPIASNKTRAGKAKNRRVEIKVTN